MKIVNGCVKHVMNLVPLVNLEPLEQNLASLALQDITSLILILAINYQFVPALKLHTKMLFHKQFVRIVQAAVLDALWQILLISIHYSAQLAQMVSKLIKTYVLKYKILSKFQHVKNQLNILLSQMIQFLVYHAHKDVPPVNQKITKIRIVI